MRIKNGKWTVPILALVPLLALAAFLAAGLLTANNSEALDDDECGFVIAVSTGNITASRGDTALTNTAPCYALGDSIDIIIENNYDEDGSDARPVNVYVSGGSDYSKVQMAADGEYEGTVGVAEYTLDVPQPNRRNVAGRATVTVPRSMGKSSGVVLVTIYGDDADFTALNGLEATSTVLPGTAEETMVIVFLGKPSLTRIDDEECLDNQTPPEQTTCDVGNHDSNNDGYIDADTKPDPSSALMAYTSGDVAVGFIAHIDSAEATAIPSNTAGEIHIFAEVRDNQGRALAGNDDSGITFTVEYAVGSALKSNAQLMYLDPEELDETGRASIELEGWTTDDTDPIEVGPVKVTVTAMYSGPTGNLELGKVELSRGSAATGIVGGIFSVGCLVDPVAGAAATEGYDDDMFVMKDNENCMGPIMAPRFGEGGAFVVKAHLEDKLGSVVTGDLDVGLDDSVTDPIDPDDNPDELNAHGVTDAKLWVYTVDKDAMLGDHMITLDSDEKDVDDLVLTVSVAGPPVEYMISGPDSIDLGGRATFTVTAVDANDGIPHFITMDGDDDKNDTVEIVVPDIAESLVRGSELRNGVLTLDADTGMGSFTIYAPANVTAGSTARIFVSAGDVEITHTVTFGDPDAMPPTDPMDDMFTAMYTVMADSPSSGMVEVSWVTTQPISLVMLMDDQGMVAAWDVALLALGSSAQFSGIQAGEYQVVVFSLTAGDFSNGGLAFGSVTVE